MEKLLYPQSPLRAIITGPSNSGKTHFLTNLILNIIDDFQKIYIYTYIYIYIQPFITSRIVSKNN